MIRRGRPMITNNMSIYVNTDVNTDGNTDGNTVFLVISTSINHYQSLHKWGYEKNCLEVVKPQVFN